MTCISLDQVFKSLVVTMICGLIAGVYSSMISPYISLHQRDWSCYCCYIVLASMYWHNNPGKSNLEYSNLWFFFLSISTFGWYHSPLNYQPLWDEQILDPVLLLQQQLNPSHFPLIKLIWIMLIWLVLYNNPQICGILPSQICY